MKYYKLYLDMERENLMFASEKFKDLIERENITGISLTEISVV